MDKIEFIQNAIRLNYLKQSVLVEFFQEQSYDSIPENIGEILIQKNLLTQEQVEVIYQKAKNLQITDSVTYVSLDLAAGKTIEIEIPQIAKNETSAETIEISQEKTAPQSNFSNYETDVRPEKTTQRILPSQELVEQEVLLEKYRVVKKLGSGGMGAVYKVEHLYLENNKYFALKVMHPFMVNKEHHYKRFIREVEMAMSITHKNIIPIREFGILPDNKGPYLTMDFSKGETLQQILKENWQCDITRSLNIVLQILEALQEAHRLNIIHRDIKPANILIEKDSDDNEIVKVVDFGLARLVEVEDDITQGTVGTPKYMPPEQAKGGKVDQRADIYSTAVVLFRLTTGGFPFESETWAGFLQKQLFEQPNAPRELQPDFPKNLEVIILKGLEKNVEQRYQSVDEFIKAIKEFQSADVDSCQSADEFIGTIKLPQNVDEFVGAIELPQGGDSNEEQVQKNFSTSDIYAKPDKPTKPVAKATQKYSQKPVTKKIPQQLPLQKTQALTNANKENKETSKRPIKKRPKKNLWRFIAIAIIICGVVVFQNPDVVPLPLRINNSAIETDAWLPCWNGQWLDFTHPVWQGFSHKQQVKYARNYQLWFAKEKKLKVKKTLSLRGVKFTMVLVPPGHFWMGANQEEVGSWGYERPRHKVIVDYPFWISETEVTQQQWYSITKKKPWDRQRYSKDSPKSPANYVSWDEINRVFLPALGDNFFLPTEIQWEYACRAGTSSRFYWGEDPEYKKINRYAWYNENTELVSEKYPHPVAKKRPNPWKLYDMSGNVWEWCLNRKQSYPLTAENMVLERGKKHSFRGGGWLFYNKFCRSATRGSTHPKKRYSYLGFRIVMIDE